MILFVNPQVTRPRNRRFPLSIMALGAALPPEMSWEIVDGNCAGNDTFAQLEHHIDSRVGGPDPVSAVAMTVMPGPQLMRAVPLARRLKQRYPQLPIVWGGYFPTLYPKPVLNAPYVDWVVRGQGEQTFLELLAVLDGRGDPRRVAGLAFRDEYEDWVGPERPWLGPDDLPPPPYHKIDVDEYIHPTFLGQRSAVYQASVGCPYGCKFCGVIGFWGSQEKMETPARTAQHLSYLVTRHGVDAIHFYDNNFFVREDHAIDLCERMIPLNISWWCEARVDAMLRFSDSTWRTIKRSGLKMIFFGAESGSNAVLRQMKKRLTIEETLEVAAKTREYGIIPEFSFVLGGPDDPEGEIETTLAFVRKLKDVNPKMELIAYFYTPTPQRRGTYGDIDPYAGTPTTLEEWTRPEWVRWMTHEDPNVPWMNDALKARVENFALVLQSRFPSVHDTQTRQWGKALTRALAVRPWRTGQYDRTRLIRAVRKVARIPRPDPLAYGHLRPSAEAIR
jgi:anaerobic magnesium-protoporphyrin IX monomethyl ester cyclase